jgi:hypothetical protein
MVMLSKRSIESALARLPVQWPRDGDLHFQVTLGDTGFYRVWITEGRQGEVTENTLRTLKARILPLVATALKQSGYSANVVGSELVEVRQDQTGVQLLPAMAKVIAWMQQEYNADRSSYYRTDQLAAAAAHEFEAWQGNEPPEAFVKAAAQVMGRSSGASYVPDSAGSFTRPRG